MDTSLLQVEGICKHFGGVVALKDVSFEIKRGEIVGLMGPNGAGKTTMLNIVAGDYGPDSGKVIFKGKNITGFPSHKTCHLGIARTYQIPQPFTTLSVWDHLRVGSGFGNKSGKIDEKEEFEKILDLTSLTNKKDTLARNLPILALKKLELARALACQPELLLMDEVAAGLTELDIPKMLNTIKGIHNSGKTIILIEHVMKVLTNAVDRIVVLDKGEKLCDGDTNSVINDCKVIDSYFGTK